MVEISVIIPVYNSEEYLEECINSILNQTFKDIEVICVDDGSTDSSLILLSSFAKKDSRVHVYHQENQGGGNARNFALTKAVGKYIYFMDSDDILYEQALERCYNACESNNVDFLIFKAINYKVSTDEYFETEYFSMNHLYNFVGDKVFNIEDIGELIFNISATPWGKLYNRDFVMHTGAQFAEGISFHDNKFFWDMLFNSKRVIFLNEIFYVRRLHSSSLIGSKNKGYFNIFIAFDQIFTIFKKYDKFNTFKSKLYNWKLDILFFRYVMIHKEFKQEFYERLKDEYWRMSREVGFDDFSNILTPINKTRFFNVIESANHYELDLLMDKYECDCTIDELNSRILRLNDENEKLINKFTILTEENSVLKSQFNELNNERNILNENITLLNNKNMNMEREIDSLKNEINNINEKYIQSQKLNNSLLNSKSWKLTEPLRKLKHLFN